MDQIRFWSQLQLISLAVSAGCLILVLLVSVVSSVRGRVQVGIIISDSAVRLVKVRVRRHGAYCLGLWKGSLPPEAVTEGRIRRIEPVAQALNLLVRESRSRGVPAVFTISNPQSLIRRMTLPPMPDREMSPAIGLQIEQFLPGVPGGACFDFEVLSRTAEHTEVVVGAAARGETLTLARLGTSAGLRVVGLEPDAWSHLRVLGSHRERGNLKPKVSLLIDLDEISTRFTFFRDYTPYFQRSSSLAPGRGDWVNRFLAEIRVAVESFLVQQAGGVLSEVFVVGCQSGAPGLIETIQEYLTEMMSGRLPDQAVITAVCAVPSPTVLIPDRLKPGGQFESTYFAPLGAAMKEVS